MKNSTITLLIAAAGLFSCEQNSKPTPGAAGMKNSASIKNTESTNTLKRYIHTEYEYVDSMGARITIQNSLPKGGLNYIDSTGKRYIYAVFWTRILNETAKPFELAIDFPSDSFELPPSSGNYTELLLPADTLTLAKVPLFNYGLAVKPFLDAGIHKSSSLRRTINPKEASGFYVVTLATHGVNGTLRTGLRIKEQQLFYKINDKEITCGNINLHQLIPRN
ncbi:hypothetical protein ACFPAF_18615 [Hymenobacter endophyticus]|uniref:Uncharacterized protein n=1 Tax=Hymenobacter endophyticus TaxID=3076335 RepID=A0ABU3TM11_9BACT|nr:hypothetical protein [Hymenobacter endophyticus]MDU0372421.1 hypothetical protein [Hymenobacter endophyticus]